MRQRTGKLKAALLPHGGRLSIGGIGISFSAPPAFRLRIVNPSYRRFVFKGASLPPFGQMQVRLKREGWPRLEGLKKAFDTGDSWSLFRDGSRSLLCLAPAGRPHPLWVAAFTSGAKRVDLFCPFSEDNGKAGAAIDLPFVYPLDQLLLMHYFARLRGVLVHGAGLKFGKRIFLFAGASGAGKSTFSELLVKAGLGTVLSDERMIVRSLKGEMLAFGTPWAGTANIARPGCAPLAGIFFLRHGLKNEIQGISAGDASDRLLGMASIPWYDPDEAAPVVAFAKKVCAAVVCREFRFTPDPSAVECLRRHHHGIRSRF